MNLTNLSLVMLLVVFIGSGCSKSTTSSLLSNDSKFQQSQPIDNMPAVAVDTTAATVSDGTISTNDDTPIGGLEAWNYLLGLKDNTSWKQLYIIPPSDFVLFPFQFIHKNYFLDNQSATVTPLVGFMWNKSFCETSTYEDPVTKTKYDFSGLIVPLKTKILISSLDAAKGSCDSKVDDNCNQWTHHYTDDNDVSLKSIIAQCAAPGCRWISPDPAILGCLMDPANTLPIPGLHKITPIYKNTLLYAADYTSPAPEAGTEDPSWNFYHRLLGNLVLLITLPKLP